MVDKISVQIALEGGDDVAKQLAAIGQAGDQALSGINEAGSTAAQGIAQVGEASQAAAEQTQKAAGAFSNLSLEAAKTSTEIAKNTAEFALHGVEIVQAVRHHDTLLQSLLKLVTGFNTATRVIASLTPELAAVGVTVGSTAAAIAVGAVAFEAVEKVLTKFAGSMEKISNTLKNLSETSGKSFDDLQRGEAAFGQIGIAAETFRSTIVKVQDTLAGTEVTNLSKGLKDVSELVKQIAAGDKTITFAGWVTAEDKIKGVGIAMKQAADSGQDAVQVLLEFVRNADRASAINVGAAFGLSETDVDRVRRLGENVSDLFDRIKGAPTLIGPEAAANFDKMRTSIQNVDSAWSRLKQAFESTIFSSLAASFSSTMNDIEAAAVRAVARVLELMNQAGRALATPPPELVNFFKEFGKAAEQAVGVANSAIANFVGGLLRGFGASEDAIKSLQNQINGVTKAADGSGKAAQTAGAMFTSFGTVAQQGVNSARAGAEKLNAFFPTVASTASEAGTKGAAALNEIGTAAESGSDKVAAFLSNLTGLSFDRISGAGVAAWNALVNAVRGADAAFDTFASNLVGITWDAISGAGVSAWNAIVTAVQGAASAISTFVSSLFSITWDAISGAGVAAWDAIVAAVQAAGTAISTFVSSLFSISWDPIAAGVAAWNAITEAIGRALSAMAAFVGATPQGGAGQSAPAQGLAGGGLLGGRGTGTSDSNLAWVSRGEHIMPARAVAQPGVLAFLEALRRSGGNLSRVLDGMGRFAFGGTVPRPAMAFAAGGPVGRMSNVTIQFPGLPSIGGLRASADVVDQLHKAAALAQVRSGGRKPSRYS